MKFLVSDSDLYSDDHFDSHLLGNGLYKYEGTENTDALYIRM